MLIDCPCCGMRMASEFTYMGDATVTRPFDNEQDVSKWNAYIFQRKNPKGWHHEYWQHTGGCRAVLKVNRNTETHEIKLVQLVGPWSDSIDKKETSGNSDTIGESK